jgi:hypothetical protein
VKYSALGWIPDHEFMNQKPRKLSGGEYVIGHRSLAISRKTQFAYFVIKNHSPQRPSTRPAHHNALSSIKDGFRSLLKSQAGVGVLPV